MRNPVIRNIIIYLVIAMLIAIGFLLITKKAICSPPYPSWYGDANLDGSTNMGDITFIERYILELVPVTYKVSCDVNQNGEVDMGDVVVCERIILGVQ